MNIAIKLRQTVKMGDFFNTSQMLRFDNQSNYRTLTGGLISIGIIITIVIAFASMIQDTLNRTTISYTYNVQRNGDAALIDLTISPQKKFMFAVQIQGYNLSTTVNRYFNVELMQLTVHNMTSPSNDTMFPMEACTKEHWAMLPQVVNKFDILGVSNWICPKIGTQIQVTGKYSSQLWSQIGIFLNPCLASTDQYTCAPYDQIKSYVEDNGQLNFFNFYYVNSMVNADQPQYKSYYLEDRAFITFSTTMGSQYDMYIRQISIQSDVSIWPFQDLHEDSVYNIDYAPILYPFAVSNNTSFARIYIMADYSQQSYQRQVQKIFVVFSFIGGLVGAIMASLFIINSYTSFSYEMAIAKSIFRNRDQENADQTTVKKQQRKYSKRSANILHFLQFQVYQIIQKIKPNIKWPFIQYIQECRQEILVQLDVKKMIKRIIFLEYAISGLLNSYQLSQLQKNKPILPSQIKILRQKLQENQTYKTKIQERKTKADIPVQFDPEHQSNFQDNIIPTGTLGKQGLSKNNNQIQIQCTQQEFNKDSIISRNVYTSEKKDYRENIKRNQILLTREAYRRPQLLQVIQKKSNKNFISALSLQNSQRQFHSIRK